MFRKIIVQKNIRLRIVNISYLHGNFVLLYLEDYFFLSKKICNRNADMQLDLMLILVFQLKSQFQSIKLQRKNLFNNNKAFYFETYLNFFNLIALNY